jgi:4-alpha-glucanotransferase
MEADLMASPLPPAQPSPASKEALSRAAELWGVEPSYWDIFGTRHFATEEVIRAILRSLGVDTSSAEALEAAMLARHGQQSARPLAPTVVITAGGDLPVSLPPETADATADVHIHLEDGSERTFQTRLTGAPIPLPRDLPLGYHQIALTIPAHGAECVSRLIVCPEKAYAPPEGPAFRAAGIGVSLYGLRSAGNWGCGDFSDLLRFTTWAVDALGASFIALNPLHAIHNRAPYNTSPYLPNCAYYRNFIYIDVEAVPEFASSCWARHLLARSTVQRELASLREAGEVQYERVSRIKLRFLKLAFREFLKERRAGSARAREFQAWADGEGLLLRRFALHSALDEAIHSRNPSVWNWPAWPEPLRSPGSPETAEFAEKHWRSVLFYQYVQWIADQQLARAQAHARSLGMHIGLYHDLALATDRYGADLWMLPEFYMGGCRVGAPPDDFSPKGQDWGFPPPNSGAHYRDGYRLFAASIRKACQHGGALRIDHVMRFFRLYWIPDGMEASAGTYVRDRYDDLIRILALESVRSQAIIVGEDLGTVPDHVRETLAHFGILSYRLFYFEQDGNRQFKLPGDYPRLALVSASTHDLPTLAGFWQNRDILARREAGVLPDDETMRRAIAQRLSEKQRILDLLHRLNLLPEGYARNVAELPELTGELHGAIVGFLMSTPSMLLLLNQEDLFKETEQQNLPGTTAEYPNWRRKMKYSTEELTESPAREFAAMFRAWAGKTNRLNAAGAAPAPTT